MSTIKLSSKAELSRYLAWLLRQNGEVEGLLVISGRYVDIWEILKLQRFKIHGWTFQNICDVINDKTQPKRFAMKAMDLKYSKIRGVTGKGQWAIRANGLNAFGNHVGKGIYNRQVSNAENESDCCSCHD